MRGKQSIYHTAKERKACHQVYINSQTGSQRKDTNRGEKTRKPRKTEETKKHSSPHNSKSVPRSSILVLPSLVDLADFRVSPLRLMVEHGTGSGHRGILYLDSRIFKTSHLDSPSFARHRAALDATVLHCRYSK